MADLPDPETILVDMYPESFTAFRDLMPMPSTNPSLGGTLEANGFAGEGILLTWTDQMGTVVWRALFRSRHG